MKRGKDGVHGSLIEFVPGERAEKTKSSPLNGKKYPPSLVVVSLGFFRLDDDDDAKIKRE